MKTLPWPDLASKLDGELSTAPAVLKQHSEDASLCHIEPLAVLFPKHTKDIQAALEFCSTHSIPVFPWGAGTSRAGQALGQGLIIDFHKTMKEVLHFDAEQNTITVQPGISYASLESFLAEKNLQFLPRAALPQSTVGGMVAKNSMDMVDHIQSLEFLTADGQIHRSNEKNSLKTRVHKLLATHWDEILVTFPQVKRNSSGYNFPLCYEENPVEQELRLEKLLTGSEGTLGIFTEITLKTVAIPKHSVVLVAYFKHIASAFEAAIQLPVFDFSSCELVDKIFLDAQGESALKPPSEVGASSQRITQNPYLDRFYELESEAILLVEFSGESQEQANEKSWSARKALIEGTHIAQFTSEAKSPEDCKKALELCHPASLKSLRKSHWLVEDFSLPPARLKTYLEEQRKIFQKHGLLCSFYGAAAHAHLSTDPVYIDPRSVDGTMAKRLQDIAKESYELVIRLGGTISATQGDGLLRTPFLRLQYPISYPLFKEMKEIFDPNYLLNPGKIVGGTT